MQYIFAHTLKDHPPECWEKMHEHESRVAKRCSTFLSRIDPSLHTWGNILGRWHDLGKYSDEFQKYLSLANDVDRIDLHGVDVNGTVDHSTAAAQFAIEQFGLKGRMLAYPFAIYAQGRYRVRALYGRVN